MFPAYSTAKPTETGTPTNLTRRCHSTFMSTTITEPGKQDLSWLSNPSFEKFEPPIKPIDANSNQSDEDVQPSTSHSSRSSRSSHKKKRKKDHKEHKSDGKERKSKKEKQEKVAEVMEFDGTEEYYVDKKAERGYLRVQTLHRPACPR